MEREYFVAGDKLAKTDAHAEFITSEYLIGLGKPASKTADWIVDTYLPNAPVSNRLSIEHAIQQAIINAACLPGFRAAMNELLVVPIK